MAVREPPGRPIAGCTTFSHRTGYGRCPPLPNAQIATRDLDGIQPVAETMLPAAEEHHFFVTFGFATRKCPVTKQCWLLYDLHFRASL